MTLIAKNVHILLVDDNDVDAMAFRRGMKKHGLDNALTVAINGRDALEHLRGENGKNPIERPLVIFLDMHMPVMDGVEFLHEVSKDNDLSSCMIFVLTSPGFDEDRLDAYQNQVTGFVLKSNLTDACLVLADKL